ncbi:radical SAM protein [bacterium]|nr:radical SAM protein [candidate division CSSED10-310 bacterium]
MYEWFHPERERRLLLWSRGIPAPPLNVSFLFTQKCQFHCRFCNATNLLEEGKNPDFRELDTVELCRLAEAGSRLGITWWELVGGEPAYDIDRLITFIEAVRDNGMSGHLISNGWGWTEAAARRVVEVGWNALVFSVYSHRARIHDDLVRRKGALDRILGIIGTIQAQKNRLRKKQPHLYANVLIHRYNIRSIHKITARLAESGVSQINFQNLFHTPTSGRYLEPSPRQQLYLQRQLTKITAVAAKHKIGTNILTYKDPRMFKSTPTDSFLERITDETGFSSVFCYDPWLRLNINATGRVFCCRTMIDSGESFRDHGDLQSIWQGAGFERLRRALLLRKLPNSCQHCCAPILDDNEGIRKALAENETRLPTQHTAAESEPPISITPADRMVHRQ